MLSRPLHFYTRTCHARQSSGRGIRHDSDGCKPTLQGTQFQNTDVKHIFNVGKYIDNVVEHIFTDGKYKLHQMPRQVSYRHDRIHVRLHATTSIPSRKGTAQAFAPSLSHAGLVMTFHTSAVAPGLPHIYPSGTSGCPPQPGCEQAHPLALHSPFAIFAPKYNE